MNLLLWKESFMNKWEGKTNFIDMKRKEEKFKNLKGEKIKGSSNLEETTVEDMNKCERILLNPIQEDQSES